MPIEIAIILAIPSGHTSVFCPLEKGTLSVHDLYNSPGPLVNLVRTQEV